MIPAIPILMRVGTVRPPNNGNADKMAAVRTRTIKNCQTCWIAKSHWSTGYITSFSGHVEKVRPRHFSCSKDPTYHAVRLTLTASYGLAGRNFLTIPFRSSRKTSLTDLSLHVEI